MLCGGMEMITMMMMMMMMTYTYAADSSLQSSQQYKYMSR